MKMNYQNLKKEEYKKFDKDIKRLIKNYNPDSLSENTPDSKYTSYSENKGAKNSILY